MYSQPGVPSLPDGNLEKQNLLWFWFSGLFPSPAPMLVSVLLSVSRGGWLGGGEEDGFPFFQCNHSPPSLSYSV